MFPGQIPASWRRQLAPEFKKPYFVNLVAFLDAERAHHQVFPAETKVFAAFRLTPFESMSVLLLGQDPYHDDGQAHGLAFSVPPGVAPPPSLRNIFRELNTDVGCPIPTSGSLVPWASQGVLLLNAVLTVRAHEPNSHRNKGWDRFTDAAIDAVSARREPVVFVLWGAAARTKGQRIDRKRHAVIESAHPSPLSARNFLGSKPFSKINAALESSGQRAIDWRLP